MEALVFYCGLISRCPSAGPSCRRRVGALHVHVVNELDLFAAREAHEAFERGQNAVANPVVGGLGLASDDTVIAARSVGP